MTGLENGTLYNEDMKGISTDNASFEFFRKHDVLYVDKTEFIYKLLKATPRRFFFISRPRRFGKSLFCNTLESLFKGEKELFKGLYIYDKYDFRPHPVLHFDFNNLPIYDLKAVGESLSYKVESASSKYDVKFTSDNPISDSKQPSNPYTVDTER